MKDSKQLLRMSMVSEVTPSSCIRRSALDWDLRVVPNPGIVIPRIREVGMQIFLHMATATSSARVLSSPPETDIPTTRLFLTISSRLFSIESMLLFNKVFL